MCYKCLNMFLQNIIYWVFSILILVYQKIINATGKPVYSRAGKHEANEMSPRNDAYCLLRFLRQIRSVRFFFLVSCMSFFFSIFWVEFATRQDPPVTETLIQEVIENVARDSRYKDVYRKYSTLPNDFKFILLWAHSDLAPFYSLGEGQEKFLSYNCSSVKCYVTSNRNLHDGDLTRFDAILFNGRARIRTFPKVRARYQQYVYVNSESAANYPACDPLYDGFFNWTFTYRLDSDIPSPYIQVRDSKNEIVGPKLDMKWKENMSVVADNEILQTIKNKSKAVAWFVSNCNSKGRLRYVASLQKALKRYGWTVDVYGKCGSLMCPRNSENCSDLLKSDYFFYMAMENTFAEDYVTEKVLTALQNDVVPVVYGGADYSRFLPPGSYINARKHHPEKLAGIINRLIHSPKEYSQYFRWKGHYTFNSSLGVCNICEALHDKKMQQKTSIYDNFRAWWYPDYKRRCHIY